MQKKLKILLILCACIGAFIFLKNQYSEIFTLSYLKTQHNTFMTYYQEYTVLTCILYFIIYVITATLGIPILTLLTLGGGALFGTATGTLIVSFASSIAATIAFLITRFFLFKETQLKFKNKFKKFYQGIEKEGWIYLLSLRLIPVFPYPMINLVMGLTPIPTLSFYLATQAGMLPSTLLYAYTGTQLKTINSVDDLISLKMIFILILLALFPLMAKFYLWRRSQKKCNPISNNSETH